MCFHTLEITHLMLSFLLLLEFWLCFTHLHPWYSIAFVAAAIKTTKLFHLWCVLATF